MVDAESREPISPLASRAACVQARTTRSSPDWLPRRSRRMEERSTLARWGISTAPPTTGHT